MLSVGNPVEPKLAEPSQFLAGCGGEHFGFEAHAVAAIGKQVHDELCAHFGTAFNSHRGVPLAVAGEIGQDVPDGVSAGVDIDGRIDREARHGRVLRGSWSRRGRVWRGHSAGAWYPAPSR